MNLDKEFLEWLELNKNLSKRSATNYTTAVRTISRCLSQEFKEEINIFEISDENQFNKIMRMIEKSEKTLERYNTGKYMYSNGMKHYGEFVQLRFTSNQDVYYEDEPLDKKIIISKFTKDLLHEKGFLLDHSDNTRIRFSTERLDSVVGFLGEGWSKQIKRLLLFEIENRTNKYTLKLIIGPGNQAIREVLYNKAKENIELYNTAKKSFTNTYTTIYSKKILTEEQLTKFSVEEIKKYIKVSLEQFIKCDLNRLCNGVKSQQQIDLENQLLNVINNDMFNEIEETERVTYIKTRIGHSKLREVLVKKDGCCKVCGLSDERFLIASHIKPWSKSNNQERLDLNNVLLLCPHHDSAFDKGYITFDREGQILISSELTFETRVLLNLNPENKIEFTYKQGEYIQWHKENIFHT